jgi:Reverse transcriptase (RNA-dependent DNA polymerase)
VQTAFCYGVLDEVVFMEQPLMLEETNKSKGDFVCRLNKSIYGLKQLSRVWNKRIIEFIIKNQFTRMPNDNCVFFHGKEITDKEYVVKASYVDDLLIFS